LPYEEGYSGIKGGEGEKGGAMAEWRKIHTKFWVDPEWLDFIPEDRYFYLCLLTNPKTTACGVYEAHVKEFAMWTGYNTETITKLLEHFQSIGKIEYDEKTHEVFIKNWFRYNSPRSPKLHALIIDELRRVKSPRFREQALYQLELYLRSHQIKTNGQKEDVVVDKCQDKDHDTVSDTVSIQYPYSKDTVSDTVPIQYQQPVDIVPIQYPYNIAKTIDIDKDKDKDKDLDILSGKSLTSSKGEKDFQAEVEQVIGELNRLAGRSFRTTGKQTSFIRARLREGFTVEDCLLVVRDRVRRWLNDEKMREYLRPSTLFNSEKFEAYLNEARSRPIESKNIAILKQYLAGGGQDDAA
jgi:uncharacterized phage protein (TIGR02220 family)